MNNDYEPAAVVELGQAQDLILGIKDMFEEDNVTGQPPDLFPKAFAKFED